MNSPPTPNGGDVHFTDDYHDDALHFDTFTDLGSGVLHFYREDEYGPSALIRSVHARHVVDIIPNPLAEVPDDDGEE